MRPHNISFGWAAPSFAEQFPSLSQADAERADAINKAITLLSVHGIITEAERNKAHLRATRLITADLAKVARRASLAPATETSGA